MPQGVKALVYDAVARKVVGRGAQSWGILESPVPGRAEQHPATWVEVCVGGCGMGGCGCACRARCSASRRVEHTTACAITYTPQPHTHSATHAHPRTLSQGTIAAAKQALAQVDAAAVRALGVSGQQHGMVVLDAQDNVLRPAKVRLRWRDVCPLCVFVRPQQTWCR
jgi:xylulokinase